MRRALLRRTTRLPLAALALVLATACNPKAQEARALDASCFAGDAAACEQLGVQVRRGDHVLKDYRRAAELFRQACDGGQGQGCIRLARLHLDASAERQGVPLDSLGAAGLLERGCELSALEGCTQLGDMYAERDSIVPDVEPKGPTRDVERAAGLYERACSGGGMEGCARLGRLHITGEGAPADTARAIELYRQACDGGAATGCTRLGEAYVTGMGLDRDPARAAGLFEQACASEMEGCFHLAGLVADGEGVAPDWDRAIELYDKACDGTMEDGEGAPPFAQSCFRLGELYVSGVGGERDVYRAGSLFRRACRLGYTQACSRS